MRRSGFPLHGTDFGCKCLKRAPSLPPVPPSPPPPPRRRPPAARRRRRRRRRHRRRRRRRRPAARAAAAVAAARPPPPSPPPAPPPDAAGATRAAASRPAAIAASAASAPAVPPRRPRLAHCGAVGRVRRCATARPASPLRVSSAGRWPTGVPHLRAQARRGCHHRMLWPVAPKHAARRLQGGGATSSPRMPFSRAEQPFGCGSAPPTFACVRRRHHLSGNLQSWRVIGPADEAGWVRRRRHRSGEWCSWSARIGGIGGG